MSFVVRASLFVVFMTVMGCAAATDVATLTKNPVSETVLVGTNAHFHCAGTGDLLRWIVDGSLRYYQNIIVRRISTFVVPFPNSLESTLTVPATLENNGTTVRCILESAFSKVFSSCCTLTVLPGIGHVHNLRFSPLFNQVLWDPPSTAGVLSGLYYQVTVTSNGSNEANDFKKIATTPNTYYNFSGAMRCQNYTASVTAFSSERHGTTVTITQRTPGGYYELQRKYQVNFVVCNGSVVFTFNLKLMDTVLPCHDQVLRIQTFPRSNASDITSHPDFLIVGPGNVVYPINAGIHRKDLYTATVSVVGSEGVVDFIHLNFSTYDVQHCDVHTDHTSYIFVECTFAINSTAPGFVLIQDEHSQYTISTTLQRHEDDVSKGSVLILGVPAGEYNVTVYDEMPSIHKKPAYMYVYRHKISSTLSTRFTVALLIIVVFIFWKIYSCIFGKAMSVPTNGTPRREPEITNLFQQHQSVLAAQPAPLPSSPPPPRSTADMQHSTNPPAAPDPVVSTETKTTGQDNLNISVSADVQFPSPHVPVQPADNHITHADKIQPVDKSAMKPIPVSNDSNMSMEKNRIPDSVIVRPINQSNVSNLQIYGSFCAYTDHRSEDPISLVDESEDCTEYPPLQ